MSVDVKANFQEMQAQLRQLGKKYNLKGKNLHFEAVPRTDVELFNTLLQLSGRAIELVKEDEHRYSRNTSYALVMFDFWYDFFLIINAASNRVLESSNADKFQKEAIYRIIEDLIDVGEFSTIVLGDFYKRNCEALGNTLLAFYGDNLMERVNHKKESVTSEHARIFLDDTMNRVEEIVNSR